MSGTSEVWLQYVIRHEAFRPDCISPATWTRDYARKWRSKWVALACLASGLPVESLTELISAALEGSRSDRQAQELAERQRADAERQTRAKSRRRAASNVVRFTPREAGAR
jgi:hypothetical protein